MEQKTALYACHVACGGKIVPFAGYLLPVQYGTGIIAEHMAVRTKCGLFDVSHMGEVMLEGPDALKNLQYLLTNSYIVMDPGRIRYGILCYPDGGVVDDLLVHKISNTKYFIIVNASNREKDVQWIREHLQGDVTFSDLSDTYAELALQGPLSRQIALKLTAKLPEKYYSFLSDCDVSGINAVIAQTGYTGELGYEFYVKNENAPALWNLLLQAGKEEGLIPCGLGARDTLRLEASMPLYGHEMDETINPLEAGLNYGVKLDKDFIGRDAIAVHPLRRTRIGLKAVERGILREHQDVYLDSEHIGRTTSGCYLPYLKGAYAMALVEVGKVDTGDTVYVDVRGKRVKCEVVPLPFYKRTRVL
jgi:glycine cleavage system T protein